MTKTNRLRVIRAERGISQLDLALKIGLSPNRYWRIENGYTQPTQRELDRLAASLKVSGAELGIVAGVEEKAS